MVVEYSAIALGLVGMMFFMLEFGTRINFQTSGRGIIDINDIAKSVFVILSFVIGIALTLFMYSVATGNTAAIEDVLLVSVNFWIFMTAFLLLLFIFYYFTHATKTYFINFCSKAKIKHNF
jgi:sterol desaturase/sphingolipid hydroxylase (fatty acid hydroxylase superfamily)